MVDIKISVKGHHMENEKITQTEMLQRNNIDINVNADIGTASFWYYTSLNNADKILENSCFHIRSINDMNDKDEAGLHKNSKFVHALCLCNSDTEKIPMWYLYSGLDGKGVSIGFTASTLLKFVRSIKTVKVVSNEDIELSVGKEVTIKCGWIFYRKKDQPEKIKYRNKFYELTDFEFFEQENYFVKDYPWEYEKEFRIVVINNTAQPYEKFKIDIPIELYKNVKIRFAPEFQNETIYETIKGYKGVQKLLAKKMLRSNLKINMGLYERNAKGVVDFISCDINKEKTEIDREKLRGVICKTCKLNKENR